MESNKKVVELRLDDILPNRFQPRIKFDETAINDLADSIKEHGVIQPIVVRKIGDKYEIIAGERRYKASTMAGKETIPAIITELNDKDSAEVALIENVQRQNLTPIEEAVSYKKILDMGYLTQEQLANKLGKSQSAIANKLRLLNLDDEVQEALLNGEISERHARSLLKLPHSKDQVKMLNRIIEERLTVRRTDEEIDKMLNDLFESDDFDKPEEMEEEIEHTQPLKFNFGGDDNEPKDNVFDVGMEEENNNLFDIGNTKTDEEKIEDEQSNSFDIKSNPDSTDFFGFNQNIMPIEEQNDSIDEEENKEEKIVNEIEPIEDEYKSDVNDFINVDEIEKEATDLYPKEEKKDINSFLEPTLLVDDNEENDILDNFESEKEEKEEKEEKPFNIFGENTFEEDKDNVVEETNEVELDEEKKPGKFFNLFNNFSEEPEMPSDNIFEEKTNEEQPTNSMFNSIFGNSDDEVNRFDDNYSVDNSENNEINNFSFNNFNNELSDDSNKFINSDNTETDNQILNEVFPQKLEAEEIDETNKLEDKSNINLALSKIKEYADELKKLGIDMNIEESDFENKYQITINIDK